MALRVQQEDGLCDIFMILAAAHIAKTALSISISEDDNKLKVLKYHVNKECVLLIQSEQAFLDELKKYERIRTCSRNLSTDFYRQAARSDIHIASGKPLTEGRMELLHYLKEQSISFEYHRYGSITDTEK
jgi:RHH-type proline utilization regulon transcriptional repressor/proline dehydrogenase/delta 1-pyrroline-5-carboxylate dehydrogenase